MQHEGGLAGKVDPAMVGREGLTDLGLQHVTSRRDGGGPVQDEAAGVAGCQHPVGGLSEDGMTGGEQRGTLFPRDVGVGGDTELFRQPVRVAKLAGEDHVRGIPGRLPEPAVGGHVPQPKLQRGVGDHAFSSSETRLSIDARLAR